MTNRPSAFVGTVAPEWLERGVWLRDAPREFGDPQFLAEMRGAAETFAMLREGQTPETHSWSSSLPHGEARDKELLEPLRGEERVVWTHYRTAETRLRESALLEIKSSAFRSGLVAFGIPGLHVSHCEWIPCHAWHYLKWSDPDENVVRSDDVAFYYVRIVRPADHPADSNLRTKGKSGPKGGLVEKAAEKMLADLRSGKITPKFLEKNKQQTLANNYGASRATAMRAWEIALSKFNLGN